MPSRIQRQRTRGWRMPEGATYVGRPGPLGNPFAVDVFGQAQAVALHRTWLEVETAERLGYSGQEATRLNECRRTVLDTLRSLRGRDLACWCRLDQPCHADVLLEIANAPLTCEAADA